VGQIGIRARTILEAMFGKKVHLILNVKIRRNNNSVTGKRRSAAFAKY
jgi:GTP-binding protein Era